MRIHLGIIIAMLLQCQASTEAKSLSFECAANFSKDVFSRLGRSDGFPSIPNAAQLRSVWMIERSLNEEFLNRGVSCSGTPYEKIQGASCEYSAVFEGYRRFVGKTDIQENALALDLIRSDMDVEPGSMDCVRRDPKGLDSIFLKLDGQIRYARFHKNCLGEDGFLIAEGFFRLSEKFCRYPDQSSVPSYLVSVVGQYCGRIDSIKDDVRENEIDEVYIDQRLDVESQHSGLVYLEEGFDCKEGTTTEPPNNRDR